MLAVGAQELKCWDFHQKGYEFESQHWQAATAGPLSKAHKAWEPVS